MENGAEEYMYMCACVCVCVQWREEGVTYILHCISQRRRPTCVRSIVHHSVDGFGIGTR